jgi:hypothetical protein
MKASKLMLLVSGVACSAAFAQTTLPHHTPPQPQETAGMQSRHPAAEATAPQQAGRRSSGESDSVSHGMSGRMDGRQSGALEPRSESGFTFVCGGVGEVEEARMKQIARGYDMMLTFANQKGEYLADVNVNIRGANGGAQLQTMCEGPIMLVDFPSSGSYRIEAETGGYTLNQTARVNTGRPQASTLVMHWPAQIGERLDPNRTSTGSSGMPEQSPGGAGQ